ncbi:MAG: hypothetical protein ABR611_02075 [Chthoniobacterales bacterium]
MSTQSDPAATPQLDAALKSIGDKIVIAIHGIGDQYKNATVRSVVSIFGRCFNRATPVPLGGFYGPDGDIHVFRATAPPDVTPPMSTIGFVEAYWADIPRQVQREGYTIEETKAWARTVVERVQAQYEDELKKRLSLSSADYLSAIAALQDMIDAIGVISNLLFLAEKMGFPKFELEPMLTAFVGDVQLVADFANYRNRIRQQIWGILEKVYTQNPNSELYIVSHSEGTVVALVALLRALSVPAKDEKQPAWIKQVRGLMTIGSPIDKHLILWRGMWENLKNPDPTLQLPQPIRWRNYYDYADPVGFKLDTARDWLKDHLWDRFFDFDEKHDHGFSRYFLPGKAHNDYWNDPYVFGHFIQDVFDLPSECSPKANDEKIKNPPQTRLIAKLSSYFTPYLVIGGILFLAIYALYTGVNTYLSLSEPWRTSARHMLALASLLAGTTVASRILCLTRHVQWKWVATFVFVFFAGCYAALIGGVHLRDPFHPSNAIVGPRMIAGTLVSAAAAIFLTLVFDRNKAFLRRWPPIRLIARGMRPLLIWGGIATVLLVLKRIGAHSQAPSKSFWPLLLSGAVFLYLWWLAGVLFDLVFTWQRYIRGAVWQKHLRQARKDRVEREKAEGVSEQIKADTAAAF